MERTLAPPQGSNVGSNFNNVNNNPPQVPPGSFVLFIFNNC